MYRLQAGFLKNLEGTLHLQQAFISAIGKTEDHGFTHQDCTEFGDSELEVSLMHLQLGLQVQDITYNKALNLLMLVKSCVSIFCMMGTSYCLNGFSLKCCPNRTKTASHKTRTVFKTLVLTINHPSSPAMRLVLIIGMFLTM